MTLTYALMRIVEGVQTSPCGKIGVFKAVDLAAQLKWKQIMGYRRRIMNYLTLTMPIILLASPAFAQDAETIPFAFVSNTLLLLLGGFLVMWMAAGFAMLEVGMVRSKNVAMQCLKNIGLYSVASIMFFIVGFNLMYDGVDGGYMGSFTAVLLPDPSSESGDYAAGSDFFFQLVFCATTASIVSGTLAERIKLWPFLIFTVALTGILYPITGAWKWGGGWLDQLGFLDFAGSTIVHAVGGFAALAGALILGPRLGKYTADGRLIALPGSSMPFATLGTFILWLGWFGFNGGSQLALGSIADASAVARIFVNTNMAAAGGVIAAIVITQLLYRRVDLTMCLNGALAGLVSITAEPLTPNIPMAILIGGVGGALVVFSVPLLDRLRIDDVVGAIPVHLLCGIWGTMAVPLTNGDAQFVTQLIGIAAIGAFIFVASLGLWLLLKISIGLRLSAEDERLGLDQAELGIEAYPEFGSGHRRV